MDGGRRNDEETYIFHYLLSWCYTSLMCWICPLRKDITIVQLWTRTRCKSLSNIYVCVYVCVSVCVLEEDTVFVFFCFCFLGDVSKWTSTQSKYYYYCNIKIKKIYKYKNIQNIVYLITFLSLYIYIETSFDSIPFYSILYYIFTEIYKLYVIVNCNNTVQWFW